MAYEYHTKVPFGLKILQLSTIWGSGDRFVQKSAGNVRNDLSRPSSPTPESPFVLSCRILRPFGPLVYGTYAADFHLTPVRVCEKAMRAENLVFSKQIRWNPKTGGIYEGYKGYFFKI